MGAHLIQHRKYSPVGSRKACGYSGRDMQALPGPHADGGLSKLRGRPMVPWFCSSADRRGHSS